MKIKRVYHVSLALKNQPMKIFSLHSAPLTGLVSQTSENKVASSQFGAQYDDRVLKLRTRLWLLQRVLSQTSANAITVRLQHSGGMCEYDYDYSFFYFPAFFHLLIAQSE